MQSKSKKEKCINSCHQMSNFKTKNAPIRFWLGAGSVNSAPQTHALADLRGLFLRAGRGRKERGGKGRNGEKEKKDRDIVQF